MTDRDLSRVRTRIGHGVPAFALWPHLSVLQNIIEAPIPGTEAPKAEAMEEALALLRRSG